MTIKDGLIGIAMLFMCLLAASFAKADVIDFPAAQHSSENIQPPVRGQSMAQVQKSYGQPRRKHAPVSTGGNPLHPPITRWDYPKFSVFFERELVIHSVIPTQTPRVSRR